VAREVGVEGKLGGQASVPGASGTWRDLTDNVNQLAANLTTQVRAIAEVATAVTKGDLTRSIALQAQGEMAALKDNINEMIRNLRETTQKNADQDWLKTNLAKFSQMLQGQKDLLTVGRLILSELAPVVSAQQGVFYIMDSAKQDEPLLKLLASYAYKERKNVDNKFKLGEGLVGQCALEKEKILLTAVPADYIQVSSGLGEAKPLNIMVLPIVFEGAVKAVMELASFNRFRPEHETFLEQLTESIGIVLNTIEANMRTEDLLKQSQSLAGELQNQQQELQQTNAELKDKAKLLADQNVEVERRNKEVEQARQALDEKAKQLALTSKYKSEFLANMSHELRTPLNSLLILSDQLSKNSEGNLTPRQVEFSKTIHSSGNDLLTLINDILDLSKIESGTVIVDIGEVAMRDLRDYVNRTFRHVAENKKLEFQLEFDANLPRVVHTDAKRLQQIIKNLLSNAFKFTDRGSVRLEARAVESGWTSDHPTLSHAKAVIAFEVKDTGIGIPPEKQQIIFEAFQQADGSTSRKYGGTGLGLAISREIAGLLGGEIKLHSESGVGSCFTLYVPASYVQTRSVTPPVALANPAAPLPVQAVMPVVETPELEVPLEMSPATSELTEDDLVSIVTGDNVLLVVENDLHFARVLRDIGREHGFKVAIALRGSAGLQMARTLSPSAITLDINLPDIDGWRVLNRLKDDSTTRHIPVQIITTEEERHRGLRMGAMGVLTKPIKTKESLDEMFVRIENSINPKKHRVVVADSDPAQHSAIASLIGGEGIEVELTETPEAATETIKKNRPDLIVTDLPEKKSFDFIDEVKEDPDLAEIPMIVQVRRELSKKDELHLKRLVQTTVLKDVRSAPRLADEAALFLHRQLRTLPAAVCSDIEKLHEPGTVLQGKKILVVDDDIRNIFAMTSILEPFGVHILSAETGRAAIGILQNIPDVDAVLMDIMMPDMDGYDTMRAIRKLAKFRALPIIALTAKAMKGDREKCIQAGASDYISKPVDTQQLLALLRVWLYR
jgi:signal transduction histidine kinase/CheY-like chemotaxis protein/HAMP domain-containing protein